MIAELEVATDSEKMALMALLQGSASQRKVWAKKLMATIGTTDIFTIEVESIEVGAAND